MELSYLLARLWGLYLIIISLSFLFNRKGLEVIITIVSNRALVILGGFISLLIGIIMVVIHNVWTPDWRIILTLFGWLAIIKGVVYINWPELALKWGNKFQTNRGLVNTLLVIALIFGIYLTYMGFIFNFK